MASDPTAIDIIARIINAILFVILYFLIGFGPGFIIGMLLANKFIGPDKPMRYINHEANIQKAGEHNKQWDPALDKWKK